MKETNKLNKNVVYRTFGLSPRILEKLNDLSFVSKRINNEKICMYHFGKSIPIPFHVF